MNEKSGVKPGKANPLVGCPFCGAPAVKHDDDCYKVNHASLCFIAMKAENGGWIQGKRQIKAWEERASSRYG
jgi:hypothetical protein